MQPPFKVAFDARRSEQQSAKGNLWKRSHPERARALQSKYRNRAVQLIDEQRTPINIYCDNVLVTSDFHIPFHDPVLVDILCQAGEENSVDTLMVSGDFWDCDNYSKFTRKTWTFTFKEEIHLVREVMNYLLDYFKIIYFCRGNHEHRWIAVNTGMVGMDELFATTCIPTDRYKVTLDDHMYLYQGDEKWLLCHPKSFRQTNLSVVRDLAAKHQCNVIGGHGHQWAQGYDKSGTFVVADGGGLFQKEALDYLRETTCHPMVRSGFYLLQDNDLITYSGI
jgi:predicted phosphodiesterase